MGGYLLLRIFVISTNELQFVTGPICSMYRIFTYMWREFMVKCR